MAPTAMAPSGETEPPDGGDGDQAGDRAGGGAEGGEGAVAQLLVDEPAEHGGGGGDLGVEEHDRADAVVVAEPGAGVEAEPAEPQQGRRRA